MVDERLPLSKTLIDLRVKELELEEKARIISELKSKGDDASIKQLAEKLRDDSWHLRELTVRALSELGSEIEQYVLNVVPSSLWFTRACAAEVLGNVRSKAAISCLMDLLGDSNATVRERAAKALLQICHGGHTVWVARQAVSQGGDMVRRLQSLFEKLDRSLSGSFATLTQDVDLMKAPPEHVEKIAEEMARSKEGQDLVWEELTGDKKTPGKRTPIVRPGEHEGPTTSGPGQGGGESGSEGGEETRTQDEG